MKDIFEILKHENHELESIKHGNEYIFGCKECGKTLLTETYVIQNIDEYENILKTLKSKNEFLYENIKMLGINILKIHDKYYDYMKEQVMLSLKEIEDRNYLSKSEKIYRAFDIEQLLLKAYKKFNNIEYLEKLIKICYSKEEICKIRLLAKEKLLELLKNDIASYSFYNNDEEKTFGCKKYKIYTNGSNKQFMFFSINNKLAEELEEEHPTPTDIYTFKDEKDFYEKEPDWEDEEENNFKFKEYVYRIENDLYDFRNIKEVEKKIIIDSMHYFSDFEYVQRYIVPLKKILKEKHNIIL